MDWQDLAYFLALVRHGSMSAAAKVLNVDHATVSRRIASLEKDLGLRLTERLPRRTTLTAHGQMIAAVAGDMNRTADRVKLQALSLAATTKTVVRVSASPAVAARLIAPEMARFTEQHPGITLSLSGVSHHAQLDKGEADIAVRLTRPEDPDLLIRRIGTMRFGLYAAPTFSAISPEHWTFIAYEDRLDYVTQQQWLNTLLAGRTVVFRASDLMAQQQAARTGLGAVVLPCFMGEADAALVSLPVVSPGPARDIWLAAYPEVRRSAAAIRVMDFLAEIVGRACPPEPVR
ncbi:LysR family transcriptional regulator [Erwinia persicina]|uniref:LysR family transcriptional regulator n=1 Tax=Erwinia persicina TaxID=55211 RepID=UPI0021027CA7|nr:LysR family transcriptional regulator [Erwinia persicina]MCQ4104286.1 LysR family transcriptional regulator [Erwinia persicina]UTX11114.1 LysR family transcriptional regulator [Erwinia persicina]